VNVHKINLACVNMGMYKRGGKRGLSHKAAFKGSLQAGSPAHLPVNVHKISLACVIIGMYKRGGKRG
jgi:hypothetical protein